MKDPYLYDDCNVLINKANIKTQQKLDDFESTMVNLGIIKLLKDYQTLNKVSDIFIIHKILFENVYTWAGKSRIINIYKEEQVLNGLSVEYCDFNIIESSLSKLQIHINSINWNNLSKNEVLIETIKIISFIWKVHPFREGNTRVVALFLYFFLKDKKYKVNRDFIGKYAKYFRNALVLSSIGKYSEYQYLEEILKDSISFKYSNKTMDSKYKTIKEYNLEKYTYNSHKYKEN